MINTKNAKRESKTELLENGKKKNVGKNFPKQRRQQIPSNKNEGTLFTQCIKQLLKSGCSWVDFNLGCQIREMLGFHRAVPKNCVLSFCCLSTQ